VAYAEGEEERVLRAAQIVVGRKNGAPDVDWPPRRHRTAHRKVWPATAGRVDYDVVNVEHDPRYRDFWQTYHRMTERKGVTEQVAKVEMRRRLSLIGAMLLHKGDVDGLICGTWGNTAKHLNYIDQVIGKRAGGSERTEQDVRIYACMNGLMLPDARCLSWTPTSITTPRLLQLAEITVMAAEEMMRFGMQAQGGAAVALQLWLQHQPSAVKMRQTLACCASRRPGSKWMARCMAIWRSTARRARALMPNSTLAGDANSAGAAQYRRCQHFLQPAQDNIAALAANPYCHWPTVLLGHRAKCRCIC
jgi:malate dehydrogenase (oxaloacetate-decarboxylating)(NADP+)